MGASHLLSHWFWDVKYLLTYRNLMYVLTLPVWLGVDDPSWLHITLFNQQLYTCKEFSHGPEWCEIRTPPKNGNTARHWPFPTGHHCSIHRFCPDDRFHSRASVGLPVAALPESLQTQQHSRAITTGRLQLWAFSQVSVGQSLWTLAFPSRLTKRWQAIAVSSRALYVGSIFQN